MRGGLHFANGSMKLPFFDSRVKPEKDEVEARAKNDRA